jgi:hypothetical protein
MVETMTKLHKDLPKAKTPLMTSGRGAATRSKPRPSFRRWTPEEHRVVDRFARAIVEGRYRNVKEALPECQRELGRFAPVCPRTDVAVAWQVLCRAYDFGLPRRKHFWTDRESRLLDRCVSAVARGKYPDTAAVLRRYKRVCERAGLAARHPDGVIQTHIIVRARAMGCEPATSRRRFSPDESRIIAHFSLAVSRNEYPNGKAAVVDCLRALARSGFTGRRSKWAMAIRINAGARKMGWLHKYARWSQPDVRTIQRFARAQAAGRYLNIAAASRACRKSLERAGRFGTQCENRLAWKLRESVLAIRKKQFRPRWKPDELRIVERFAQACVRGRYPRAAAAAAGCRLAMERAGLTEHLREKTLKSRLRQRVHDIRLTR